MKLWACRHRKTILVAYVVLAITVTLVLQILETQGVFR